MPRRIVLAVVAAMLLVGCTGGTTPPDSNPRTSSEPAVPSPVVPGLETLRCGEPIDGGPVPAGWQVVLGVVALPVSPGSPALQAAGNSDPTEPALFAKTGLLVKAGHAFRLSVPDSRENRLGIGWGNALNFRPSARFDIPSCPDTFGTGWVSYPGGYWVDRPLCLPVTVRAAGREQQVRIGVGTACPGQEPPP